MDNRSRMWFLSDMSKTFRSWDVDQVWLFPPSVRELVPEGHLAHLVRDTVRDTLDLSEIIGCYSEDRGFPPYHPTMMTALLLFAYCQGVYSSRKIARACQERVDFMAVTAMQKPDFRTISDFRKQHLVALSGLFGQVLVLCQKAGLVRLGHVALDGTKIKANASKHKAMSYGRMKKDMPRLAAEVTRWFKEAELTDRSEDRKYGTELRGDELPDWVASKQQRVAKMQEAMEALEAEAKAEAEGKKTRDGQGGPKPGRPPKTPPGVPGDKAQQNFTDPDSRIMKSQDGFVQAYNAQAAVDADSQVIVAQLVTQAANDKQQLAPMVAQIKENTGRQAEELSADSGYCSEENLKELNRRHINGYIATGRQKHGASSATGARPAAPGTRTRAMQEKLKRAGHRSRYRLRKQTVEPVFGQIKEGRGFRKFLLRGIEQVHGEWSMICAAHNFLKWAAAVA
jgi:transposase